MAQELEIGPYSVRLREEGPDISPFHVLEVRLNGETVWHIEDAYLRIDPLTGRDITGEGNPDLVVFTYSGGAHCCTRVYVVDLGPEVRVFQAGIDSNCVGEFRDLEGDSVPEYLTCDDTFAYAYCPFVCSPMPRVIMRYEPGKGYTPANHLFSELVLPESERGLEVVEEYGPGALGEWDGTDKCALLHLVLPLFLSRRVAEARAALWEFYRFPDLEDFWEEIVLHIGHDPYFPGTIGIRDSGD